MHSGPGVGEIEEFFNINKCVFVVFFFILLINITDVYDIKLKQRGDNYLYFSKNQFSSELSIW